MPTKTSIGNIALTNISAKNRISNLETDTSTEAKTLRVYYEDALKFVLCDVNWGFATARKALAELSEDAPLDWDYVYTYPSDCLKARQLYDSTRRTGKAKIPFEISMNSDGTVKTIMTDVSPAYLRYTINLTDPNLLPPGFVMCFAWYLAYLIAYPLTKKKSVRDMCLEEYRMSKVNAGVQDADEEEQDDMPDSEFISTRA